MGDCEKCWRGGGESPNCGSKPSGCRGVNSKHQIRGHKNVEKTKHQISTWPRSPGGVNSRHQVRG